MTTDIFKGSSLCLHFFYDFTDKKAIRIGWALPEDERLFKHLVPVKKIKIFDAEDNDIRQILICLNRKLLTLRIHQDQGAGLHRNVIILIVQAPGKMSEVGVSQ